MRNVAIPTEIPEKVNATLIVTVKVTNRNFTKDLNNISSPVYWNFTQLFKSQVRAGKSQILQCGCPVSQGIQGLILTDFGVSQPMDPFSLPKSWEGILWEPTSPTSWGREHPYTFPSFFSMS